MERYIQIGVTALRDPATGEFLPAVPMYIKDEDGAKESAEQLTEDIGKLLAARMRRYRDACKAAGIEDGLDLSEERGKAKRSAITQLAEVEDW